MIVFSLLILSCWSATDCRWITAAHFVRENLCHELGQEYIISEPTMLRYKCIAHMRE